MDYLLQLKQNKRELDQHCAWAEYQNECQTVNNEYLTSIDSLIRGIARHMDMDTSVYPRHPIILLPF